MSCQYGIFGFGEIFMAFKRINVSQTHTDISTFMSCYIC
jgi:hypothetical protein